MTVDDKELNLRRLQLDEKKAEQEYQVRLRELGLREAEIKRTRWSSPLVLGIIAAAVAAGGNLYGSWLNASNQLAIESTKNSSQRQIEQEKAETARIFEVTKSLNPKEAAEKIKFLIEVGLISNPNRQAALEAYLKIEKPETALLPKKEPIIEQYASGWLGGGNNQSDQCQIGRDVVVQKYPERSVLLKSSSEQSKKDLFGHVEYRYFCVFEVT